MKKSKQSRTWPKLAQLETIVLDFDGVFTDNKVYLDATGNEFVRCDRGDGLGIGMLRKTIQTQKLPIDIFIVSTEKNPVVSARAAKLSLACHQGIGDKLSYINGYLAERYRGQKDPQAFGFKRMTYLGNDLNDLSVIDRAGFSVVPNDAHPLVKKHATAVLKTNGGQGFIREFVERLLKVERLSLGGIHELVSHR